MYLPDQLFRVVCTVQVGDRLVYNRGRFVSWHQVSPEGCHRANSMKTSVWRRLQRRPGRTAFSSATSSSRVAVFPERRRLLLPMTLVTTCYSSQAHFLETRLWNCHCPLLSWRSRSFSMCPWSRYCLCVCLTIQTHRPHLKDGSESPILTKDLSTEVFAVT